ncbi:helix-turn-helix domain-containing protein [Aneurinibacillus thermoaerophilus]|uniref:Helix-turn-helix domain-containing protein n=2 Tax=Aneurinibacillus group TaxID=85151 RepID=A0ABX8YE57_ANETH|nr:hypothetical protein ACH33_15050 [Aneurinibacillus sp. XH2]QYY43389.1 helix-turn-helix domain-containing protein [Aneurinibacillus thermoaerophilus]
MAAEGTSRRKIAKMLGISISTVNRVVKGKGVSEDLLEHFEQEDRLFFYISKGDDFTEQVGIMKQRKEVKGDAI